MINSLNTHVVSIFGLRPTAPLFWARERKFNASSIHSEIEADRKWNWPTLSPFGMQRVAIRIHISNHNPAQCLMPHEIDLRKFASYRVAEWGQCTFASFALLIIFRICAVHFPSQLNSHRGGATHLPLDTQLAFSQALNWVIRYSRNKSAPHAELGAHTK